MFSSKWKINSFKPSTCNVIQFLTSLFETGSKYSALGTARAALTNFVRICGKIDLSNDDVIKRFMRGVFLKRPTIPRYNYTWDVKLVLQYLSQLVDTTLLQLSGKLCMLFLLVSAQRVQTLHLLNIHDVCFFDDRIVIQYSSLLKQSRPGKHLAPIVLKSFTGNTDLCIVKTMRAYVQRTEHLRQVETKLLISTQKPHKGVSKSTVARWVKQVMDRAGVHGTYGPHSTRAVATSQARLQGVTLDIIQKTAGWTNASTFARFYNKPVEQLTVQDAVLSSSQTS